MKTRIERDSMGTMEVPADSLYGASTQRAVLNFPISNLKFSKRFIEAVGSIKQAAAQANMSLGLLDRKKGKAVVAAAKEIASGKHYDQFVVDIFQTGSGTSTNMNANEVIATLATQLLGGKAGEKKLVHQNDHVNACQSSNDVIPSAIHVAAELALRHDLIPALKQLKKSLDRKSREFSKILKPGRTHLQDATPITLGQEFSGYAAQIGYGLERIERTRPCLRELALGGTAVGTGLNTHPRFPKLAIGFLNKNLRSEFTEARNHFEAQGSRDAALELSGQLRVVATSLLKIANDIRWLSSGPRCNIFEIQLPEIQPGSSIMPAKVNPVVCESVAMVAAHVIGNDACVAVCDQQGNFELNVMMPVLAHNLLESISLLTSASENFARQCIDGIEPNVKRCRELAAKSLATVTSLAPRIGYELAAQVAKKAFKEDKTVRQAAIEMKVLPTKELDKVLNLEAMTKPGL